MYDTTHNLLRLQVDHSSPLLDCCWSSDDGAAFTAGLDGSVCSVDLATGSRSTLGVHSAAARCVLSHAGSGLLLSGGWDGVLRSFDPRANRPVGSTTPVDGNKVRKGAGRGRAERRMR